MSRQTKADEVLSRLELFGIPLRFNPQAVGSVLDGSRKPQGCRESVYEGTEADALDGATDRDAQAGRLRCIVADPPVH